MTHGTECMRGDDLLIVAPHAFRSVAGCRGDGEPQAIPCFIATSTFSANTSISCGVV